MSAVNDFHNKAMEFTELALLARRRGDNQAALPLFEQALEAEVKAIESMDEYVEPTFSVLHRSAGTLALDCNQLRRAEQLAARALAHEPPPEIAAELRDLLEQVETELKAYEERAPESVGARLIFRGEPVSGARGMSAQFFANALNNFAMAVHYVGANQIIGYLSPKGRVPYKEDYELMITGIARGSFGFRIEEASGQSPSQGQDTPVGDALNKIKAILEASQDEASHADVFQNTDYDARLAYEIRNSDARALQAIEKFLRHIADNEATFALEFRRDEVRFTDVTQVRQSADRISQDAREDDVILVGHFHGYLPDNQRIEFHVSETYADFLSEVEGTVITCRVDPALEYAEHINSNLNEPVGIEVRVRRVGKERPRFVIRDWSHLLEE